MNKIDQKAYQAVPERRYNTPHGNLDINDDYRDKWRDGYVVGSKDTLKLIKNLINKHINNYVNGEYNEFHHCIEYDGTIDKERLIKDIEKAIYEYQNTKVD